MSTENIVKFHEALAQDAALQAKVQAIQQEAAFALADKVAALSSEAGTPFTAIEYLGGGSADGALSDEELESVAGGARPITISTKSIWIKNGLCYTPTEEDRKPGPPLTPVENPAFW